MTIALRHYEQALACYSLGQHEASNGQLRSTLEAVFKELSARAGKPAVGSIPSLKWLREQSLLSQAEFELCKGLWGISHSKGAHAGLAEEDEAYSRLMLTTSLLEYLLHRVTPAILAAGEVETYQCRWYDDGHILRRISHVYVNYEHWEELAWEVDCPHDNILETCVAPSFWLDLPDAKCHLRADISYWFHKAEAPPELEDMEPGDGVRVEWSDEGGVRFGERLCQAYPSRVFHTE